MTTALATLSAYHIGANVEAFLDVLGMTDHVHIEDASFVKALDNVHRRDADSTDEELGAGINDDGHEFVELALRVVVASSQKGHSQQLKDH